MDKNSRYRLIVIFILISLSFILILSKAFYIQVLKNGKLLEYAKGQIFRESKVYPNRGNIYDRNGSPLAINVSSYSIFTIPKNVPDKKKAYGELVKIIPSLSYESILKRIGNRNNYTWLLRNASLTDNQVKEIKKLSKDGIYLEITPTRMYPNNELLAHTLGFVGLDNVGLSGIEYLFDDKLKGSPSVSKYIRDAKGRPVKFERASYEKGAEEIYLSIDKELQVMAEQLLKDAVDSSKATMGGIGVMDADTGEVLAMANYPTFNPNRPRGGGVLSFVNSPIEAGSVMKIFTAAAALEYKKATINTNYFCEDGRFQVGNHVITESEHRHKFGWLSLAEIIAKSSNIGSTKIALDLTYPKLKNMLKTFNFGEKTGIEIPGESRGIFNDSNKVSDLTLANISFGQGIAVTGIQVLAAYAAIANGGIYFKPTIIKDKRSKGKRIISRETSKNLIDMLLAATENGTGVNARINHFSVAGKTSTAQRAENGVYSGYNAGFAGFPINIDRHIVTYVYIDNPSKEKDNYYGGKLAAPVFKQINEYILFKDRELIPRGIASAASIETSSKIKRDGDVPNFIGLDKLLAKKLSKKYKLDPLFIGSGVVADQQIEGAKVRLYFKIPVYD